MSLGEFLAITAPIAFALTVGERGSLRRSAWLVCLLLILGGAAATASRGAVLAIGLALCASGSFFLWRFMKTANAWRFKPAVAFLAALTLLASPAIGAGAWKMVTGEPGASTARSSQGRIDQIEQAWPKIMQRPIGGYGSGRAARVLGFWGTTLTIDNYYLTLALDVGLPGPLALAALFVGMARLSARGSRSTGRSQSAVYAGLAGSATALFVMRMIVSQSSNLSILYVVLGALVGTAALRRVTRRAAPRRAISSAA